MDAVHYPRTSAYNNYMDEDEKLDRKIKVLYSRPQKKGRVIFGDLLPYGQEWRLGANEAIEITFYDAVEIGGKFINRGTYTMFADVNEKNWTIKLSKQRFIAGTKNRDKSQDVVAVTVPTAQLEEVREYYTVGFQKINDGLVHLIFEWDKTQAKLPINLNPAFLSPEDKSPMDLVQYPNDSRFLNFLEAEEVEANQPKIRVIYSRPQLNGRTIFGNLVKYGEPWRLGANETTEVTFFEDVTINGEKIRRGTYGMMAIPNKDNWEVVFHTNIPSWGTYNHDKESNVASITVPTQATGEKVEALSVLFEKKSDKEIHLVIAWDETMVAVPVMLN